MGGGKDGGGSKTYDYYGTIAGAICRGPVDELIAILIDGGVAWPANVSNYTVSTTYASGSVVYYQGVFWKNSSSTSAAPPSSPWTRFFLSSSTANSDGYTTLNITGLGTVRFYWGSATQNPDAYLSNGAKTGGQVNPAFKGVCYIVLDNCKFGRERTTAPNVQCIVRRKPAQSIVTGDAAALADGQANPIAWEAEQLTHPVHGAAVDVSRLDGTSFQAAADTLQDQPDLTGISPVIQNQTTVRSVTSDMIATSDAWFRHNAATNLIEAGVWVHGQAPATYVSLTVNHLVGTPKPTQQGWLSAKNVANVRFPDRERLYKDSVEQATNLHGRKVVQEPRPQSLDRKSVTRRTQAHAQGAEWLRLLGAPQLKVELRVRRAFALGTGVVGDPFRYGIRPGDWARIDIDPEPGGDQVWQFVRVLERKIPRTGDVTLSCVADITQTPLRFTPPPGYTLPNLPASPALFPAYRLLECPPPLAGGQVGRILALVQRPPTSSDDPSTSVHVSANLLYESPFDSVTDFTRVGSQRFFASLGALTADLSATAANGVDELPDVDEAWTLSAAVTASTTVLVATTYDSAAMPADWWAGAVFTSGASTANVITSSMPDGSGVVTLLLDAEVTASSGDDCTIVGQPLTIETADQVDTIWSQPQPGRSGAADDEILLVLVAVDSGAVAETDGIADVEVMSVVGWTAHTGYYSLRVLRGRRGTRKTAFTVAATEAWLIRRQALNPLSHADFLKLRTNRQLAISPDTAVFRLQPEDIRGVRPVEDCGPDISFRFPVDSLSVPTLTWQAAGNTTWPYNYADSTGGTLRLVGLWVDEDQNLTHTGLSYRLDAGPEVMVESIKLVGARAYQFDRSITFDQSGTYTIYARAGDATQLGAEKVVQVVVPAFSGSVAQPTFNPAGFYVSSGVWDWYTSSVTLFQMLCATPGAKVAWKIVSHGTPPGTITTTGGWSTPITPPATAYVGPGYDLCVQAVVGSGMSAVYSSVSIMRVSI